MVLTSALCLEASLTWDLLPAASTKFVRRAGGIDNSSRRVFAIVHFVRLRYCLPCTL
jgi:hypothetical protein